MDLLNKYGYALSGEEIASRIKTVEDNLPETAAPEVLKLCFSIMDLTTLKSNDTRASVKALVEKANGVREAFPGYPLPASICVYPNFASVVRDVRCCPELHVTTVAACFPSSQSFLDVKVQECRLAVRDGADEIDIVLALNHFLAGEYDAAAEEIVAVRKALDEEGEKAGRKITLKVILETGQASVSMLQRRLKLGYARAARIMDEMEEKGIVGPFEGSKPRQLLITREQWERMKDGSAEEFNRAVEDEIP